MTGTSHDAIGAEDDSQFDFDAFFEALQEGGRRRRSIEAHRPKADDVGGKLLGAVHVTRDLLEAHRRVQWFEKNPDGTTPEFSWTPAAQSLASRDANWIAQKLEFSAPVDEDGEPLNYHNHVLIDPVQRHLDFCHRFVRSSLDNLEALGHLVMHDVTTRAPAVVSRAALEASAACAYIMDCEVGPEERIRRLWNLEIEQLTDDLAAMRASGEDHQSKLDEREDVLKAAETLGHSVKRVPANERVRLPKILAEDGKPHDSTGDMVRALFTDDLGTDIWKNLSVISHSRSSGLMYLDDLSPRERQIPALRLEAIAVQVKPALAAFGLLGDRLEAYMGWESSSWTELFEQVFVLWDGASGGWDARIEEALTAGHLRASCAQISMARRAISSAASAVERGAASIRRRTAEP